MEMDRIWRQSNSSDVANGSISWYKKTGEI